LAGKKRQRAELSHRMDLLWERGTRQRAPRGPRPALTFNRIVQKAVAIADAEGLQAVTMQNVARHMGVTTMALYRYVASKSELMDGMVEAALGKPPSMDRALDWRARLATWAQANLGIYQRHPWALYAIMASPPFGPNQLAWFEAALNALSGASIAPRDTIEIVTLVDDHVRGSAQLLLTLAANPLFGEWYVRAMLRASADERYPRIAALVATGAFSASSDGGSWNQFEFGLERVLDGIEAHLAARRTRR
jgi:AcrR family transcriptional regulator